MAHSSFDQALVVVCQFDPRRSLTTFEVLTPRESGVSSITVITETVVSAEVNSSALLKTVIRSTEKKRAERELTPQGGE